MLTVTDLDKSFATPDGPAKVVDKVGFSVVEAECYALLGPSGCGKTTTLRCIAGLEQIDAGVIAIGDRVVSDPARKIFVPTHQRAIGMVFQSYAIWPHFDVFVNVAYPLQVQRPRLGRREIEARVMEVLGLVGMAEMARRPATRLSGGQQQRVALARAIVRRPALLLLDEPLSNLDARLREGMRKELSDLIARIGITALLVTHDQAEAFAMAHRLAIMNQGRVVQEGTPRDIYARPRDAFIARFLGAANVLRGRISRDGARATVLLHGSGQGIEIATDIADGAEVGADPAARDADDPDRGGERRARRQSRLGGVSGRHSRVRHRHRRRNDSRDRPARPRTRPRHAGVDQAGCRRQRGVQGEVEAEFPHGAP